jgi:hypothetical protein
MYVTENPKVLSASLQARRKAQLCISFYITLRSSRPPYQKKFTWCSEVNGCLFGEWESRMPL